MLQEYSDNFKLIQFLKHSYCRNKSIQHMNYSATMSAVLFTMIYNKLTPALNIRNLLLSYSRSELMRNFVSQFPPPPPPPHHHDNKKPYTYTQVTCDQF